MRSPVTMVALVTALVAILGVAAEPLKTVEGKLLPEKYILFPGIGRYTYHTEEKPSNEAHKTCLQLKGHLAIPDSPEEAEVLLQMMAEIGGTEYNEVVIGFHDEFIEGFFTTVKGKPMNQLGYQYWIYTTTGDILQNCGGLTYKDPFVPGLNDVPCSSSRQFICEYPLWSEYDLIPGHGYYKLHTQQRVWTEAWRTCILEGAYLLVLTSDAERDAVHYKYAATSEAMVWYGAHHRFVDHFYVTVLDEMLENSGFSSWAAGQPADVSNRFYPYLGISMDERGSELSLVSADALLQFICKHGLHDRD